MTEYTQRNRPLVGLANFLGNVYLLLMLLYLILRLLFGGQMWWLGLVNEFAVYTFTPLMILLPLALLVGAWRTLARLALVALIGVVWFGPFFQPPNVQPNDGPQLRVATLNTADSSDQQIEDWLRGSGADIIMLQEPGLEYTAGIAALTSTYPHQQRGRLLTLSRFPILESQEVAEGQQRMVIEIADQPIAFYNVHFAWPLANPPRLDVPLLETITRYDATDRDRQIEQLVALLEAEDLPYIVAGDFNMSQHALPYGSLALLMNDSFRSSEAGLGMTWPAGFEPFPLLRLDYIWHSEAFQALDTEIGPDVGSDHLPLLATLALDTEE